MSRARDWQGLERKIQTGKSVEQAALEAGIPLPEVYEHAKSRMAEGSATPFMLQLVAQRALFKAINRLEKIADDGERLTEVGADELDGEGGKGKRALIRLKKAVRDTDLKAAEKLADIAIAAFKIAAPRAPLGGKAPGSRGMSVGVQLDLWDTAGNWDFRESPLD